MFQTCTFVIFTFNRYILLLKMELRRQIVHLIVAIATPYARHGALWKINRFSKDPHYLLFYSSINIKAIVFIFSPVVKKSFPWMCVEFQKDRKLSSHILFVLTNVDVIRENVKSVTSLTWTEQFTSTAAVHTHKNIMKLQLHCSF